MQAEWRFIIPATHPSLAGHFPDNPIVPGVLILDQVIQAFTHGQPDQWVTAMPMVKFLAPLKPECLGIIRFTEGPGATQRFECTTEEGRLLVQGSLTTLTPGVSAK